MIISTIEDVKIEGIAAAVSNTWTSLETFGDEDDIKTIKKFMKKTGVQGRYDADVKQTTSDFCYVAARELLAKKNVDPKEIGVLVFVTQTADYGIPSTACLLQDRLGISKDCLAFDVNLGCSGFTCGINIAASLMKMANTDKALLLAGDTSAKEMSQRRKNKTSHSASWLFGDSGTATLLRKDNNSPKISMISKTDGAGFKAIIAPYGGWRNPDAPPKEHGSRMDDIEVFNFAVEEVPALLKEAMSLDNTTPDDYDCLVLHQANLFILKQIAKRTGFDMEKTILSLDEFANTSSSSVPITMVKAYGELNEDRTLRALMCGFGVGLSWSTVDAFVNVNDILPLIHTDEYFEDGYQDNIKAFNRRLDVYENKVDNLKQRRRDGSFDRTPMQKVLLRNKIKEKNE